MSARNNPKAPHNQVFQLAGGNKTGKKGWWNPASPNYWIAKRDKQKKA